MIIFTSMCLVFGILNLIAALTQKDRSKLMVFLWSIMVPLQAGLVMYYVAKFLGVQL